MISEISRGLTPLSSASQVVRHVDRLVAQDERRERDDAAVTWHQAGPLPYLAQQTVLRVLLERRRDHADLVDRAFVASLRSCLVACEHAEASSESDMSVTASRFIPTSDSETNRLLVDRDRGVEVSAPPRRRQFATDGSGRRRRYRATAARRRQRPERRSIASGYRSPWIMMVEATVLISLRSSAVRMTESDTRFSSRRPSVRVPNSGTIHGF